MGPLAAAAAGSLSGEQSQAPRNTQEELCPESSKLVFFAYTGVCGGGGVLSFGTDLWLMISGIYGSPSVQMLLEETKPWQLCSQRICLHSLSRLITCCFVWPLVRSESGKAFQYAGPPSSSCENANVTALTTFYQDTTPSRIKL